jgi:8-oxo-dGTP diphosphatase
MIDDAVCILLVKSGRICVSQRKKTDTFKDKWQFPGGKVEKGEEIRPAAIRELKEETGLKAPAEKLKCIYVVNNDPTVQHCWVFRYDLHTQRVKTIELNKQTAWRWMEPDEVLKLDLMPGIKEVIEREFKGKSC